MTSKDSVFSIRNRAMYICRGCGGEIAHPERFTKCPMCGIRLN